MKSSIFECDHVNIGHVGQNAGVLYIVKTLFTTYKTVQF